LAYINITASQLNVSKQRIQEKYMKIELLDYNFQVVGSLEGITLNGSITIDANSDMRRNATLKFVITDSSFEVESGGKIWLDKYIRLYFGIYSLLENEIIYTKLGTFVLDAPSYEYDRTNNSVQVSLLDLMSKLTGLRNGYLPGIPTLIPVGTNIRDAIISTLALGGFTQYVCDEAPEPGVVPTDLNFNQGATIYTILSGLRDIYPNYEMYFDVDGVFHYNSIPNGVNEPIQVDDSLWEDIVISENITVDFQNVKNYIEVYGRTHNPAYFSTNTTVSTNNISLTIANVTDYEDGVIYGFTLSNASELTNLQLRINSLSYRNVLLDDGSFATIIPESGEIYYCVQYVENAGGTPYWRWLGHLQAYAIAEDNNPESPFYVNGSVGIIRLPLYGGDYDNCMTDELALQRAKYELYLHSQMQNSITLSCVSVPWLDVNTLVEYTLHRNNQKDKYIIKSISYGFDVDDFMQVNMIKFYPDYIII
jgi:hypothetical protein